MAEDFYTEDIGFEPEINFDDMKNVRLQIKNGSPSMISEYSAIKQWIVKFCMTQKDSYPIYEGTGFGTRIKELFGKKRIGYGYEEAELERDFREGLPLCPAISQVTDFLAEKNGKVLKIYVKVELYNGEELDMEIEQKVVLSAEY